MRILVSCIPFDGGKSGISVYIRETVRALAAAGHELSLLLEPGVEAADVFPGAAESIHAPRWARRPAASMLWHLLVLPFLLRFRRSRYDFFFVCAANRRACAWYPLPTVATIHDLANFRVPGKYSRLRMFYLKRILPRFAMKAHHLVAISNATKNDMAAFWRCDPARVTVLYNGVPPARAPEPGARRGKSILYISRIEHPGKNHVRLVEAYGMLPESLAAEHPLVFAGADWKDAGTVRAAAAASPRASSIRFAGFVPAGEMERLWSGAGFYVFPSLYEGFGLSLVEAMARGIPCACSANGSLGEIGAGAAETFDPEDARSIARALETILSESAAERERRISAGLARAKMFSWADHAAGICSLVRNVSVSGVRLDCDTMREAVATVRSGGGKLIAFANAHCLNVASRDAAYATILGETFDKVWPDGSGVRIAGRTLGFAVPDNVNGTDLFPELAASGLTFWFLGGRPGVAEEAARRCAAKWPASKFAGAAHGYMDDWEGTLREIEAARPDVLLVALGVPAQEKWIVERAERLRAAAGCTMAVGGLLDFLSGRIPRAPLFIRRMGFEWVWRLAMEPRRMFRRYVVGNAEFLLRLRREARRRRP